MRAMVRVVKERHGWDGMGWRVPGGGYSGVALHMWMFDFRLLTLGNAPRW